MLHEKLAAQLIIDEGKRNKVYTDTVGKLTVGVGRNISDRAFSEDEIALMLENDIKLVESQLDAKLPWWRGMCDARQNVIANMAFNLGINGLLTFKNTLAMIQAGRYDAAADAMLQSKWAEQVGQRAIRLSKVMRLGEF